MEIFSFDDDEPEEEVLTVPPPRTLQQVAASDGVAATSNTARRSAAAVFGVGVGGDDDVDVRHYSFDGRNDLSLNANAYHVSSTTSSSSYVNTRGEAQTQFDHYGSGYHSARYSNIESAPSAMIHGADSYKQYHPNEHGSSLAMDPLSPSQDYTMRPTFGNSPYGFHPAHPAQHHNAPPTVNVPKPVIHESTSNHHGQALRPPVVPSASSLPAESSRFDSSAISGLGRFSAHEDVPWSAAHHRSTSTTRRPHEITSDANDGAAEMPINSASISPLRDTDFGGGAAAAMHRRDGRRRLRQHRRRDRSGSRSDFGSSGAIGIATSRHRRRRHKDSSSPSSIGSASSFGSSASSRSASPEAHMSMPRSARSRFGPPLNLADLPRAASLGEEVFTPTMASLMLQRRKAERGPFNARTRSMQPCPATISRVVVGPNGVPKLSGERSKSVGDARALVVTQRGFDVHPAVHNRPLKTVGGFDVLPKSISEPQMSSNASVNSVRSRFNNPPECKENVHGSLPDTNSDRETVNNNIVSNGSRGGGSMGGGGRGDMDIIGTGKVMMPTSGDATSTQGGRKAREEFGGDGGRNEEFGGADVDYDGGDSDLSEIDSDYTSTDEDDDDTSGSDTSVDGDFDFDLQSPRRRRRRTKRSAAHKAAAALQDLEINIRVSNSQRHAVVLRFYPWTQVKDVKDTLQRFAEYPPSYLQKLFFGSRELKNTRTLEDSAIVDGSELICTLGVVIDQSAPPIALFGVGEPSDGENQLLSAVSSGLATGYAPSLAIDGLGGTYFVKDKNGVNVAAFKPQDEEPYCPHNPRGMTGELGSATMRPGFKSGGGMEREYAASLLDNGGWCGVPLTTRAEMCHSAFHSASFTGRGIVSKVGSLQSFVHSDGTAGDYGSRTFSTQSVHKIGILDIRMLNVDRNDANILVNRQRDGSLRLIPIDHGYCLPASLSIEWYDWVWYEWVQAKKPFDEDALEFIRSINIDEDLRVLRNDLHIKDECLKLFVLANSLLIKGAAAGLTLFEIASLLMRQTESPSPIEDLMAQCTAFSIREREGRNDAQRATRLRRASVHGLLAAGRSQTERRHRSSSNTAAASRRPDTCRHARHRSSSSRREAGGHHRRHHRRSTIIGGHVSGGGAGGGHHHLVHTRHRVRGVSHDSAVVDANDHRAQSLPTDSFMENFMLHQFPERPRACSHSSSTPLDGSMLAFDGAPRSRSQGTDMYNESQVFTMSPPPSIMAAGSLAAMPTSSLGTAVVEFANGTNSNRASESSLEEFQCANDNMQPIPPLSSKFYASQPGSPHGRSLRENRATSSALQHAVDLGVFERELHGDAAPSYFTPSLRALAEQSAALASEAQRRQSEENAENPHRGDNVYTPPQRRRPVTPDASRITPDAASSPLLASSLSHASEKDIEEKEIDYGVVSPLPPLIIPTTPTRKQTAAKATGVGGTGAYVPPSLRRRRAAEAASKVASSAPTTDSFMASASFDSISDVKSNSQQKFCDGGVYLKEHDPSVSGSGLGVSGAVNIPSRSAHSVDQQQEDHFQMSPHELGGSQHMSAVRTGGTSGPGALSEFIYQRRRTSQLPNTSSPFKMMKTLEVLPEHCEATPLRAASASAASTGTSAARSGLSAALHRERSKSERAPARASNLSRALSRASQPNMSPAQSPKRRNASAFTFASSPKSTLSGPGSPRVSTPGRNTTVKLSPSIGDIYPPSHSPTRFTLKSPRITVGQQPSTDDVFISMPRPVVQSCIQPRSLHTVHAQATVLTPQQPPPVVLPHRMNMSERDHMTIMGNKNVSQQRTGLLARSPSPAQALSDLHRSLSPSFNPTLRGSGRSNSSSGKPPQPLFEGTRIHPLAPAGGTLSPLQDVSGSPVSSTSSSGKYMNRPPAITIPSPTAVATPPFTFSPTNAGFGGFSMPNRSILREMAAEPEEEPASDFVQASGLMNAPVGSLAIVPLQRNASQKSINSGSSFDISPLPVCEPTHDARNVPHTPTRTRSKRNTSSASNGSFLTVDTAASTSDGTPRSRGGVGVASGLSRGGLVRPRGGGGLTRTSSMFLLSDYAKATKDGYATPRKQPTDGRTDSPFDSKNLHSLEVSERQRRKIIRRYVSPLFDAIFMEKANTALDLLVKREAGKKLKKQMQNHPHTAPSSIHGGSPSTFTPTPPTDADANTAAPLSSSFRSEGRGGLSSLTPPPPSLSTQSVAQPSANSGSSSGAYVPPHKRFSAKSGGASKGAYVPPHMRRAAAASAATASSNTDASLDIGHRGSLATPRPTRGVSTESFHSNASSSNASRRAAMGPPVPTDMFDGIIFTDDIGDMSEYFDEE